MITIIPLWLLRKEEIQGISPTKIENHPARGMSFLQIARLVVVHWTHVEQMVLVAPSLLQYKLRVGFIARKHSLLN